MPTDRDVTAVFTDECYIGNYIDEVGIALPSATIMSMEEVINGWFGDSTLSIAPSWKKSTAICVSPDGSQGDVTKHESQLSISLGKSDVVLHPAAGLSVKAEARLGRGRVIGVKVAVGLLGDVSVAIAGTVKTIEYTCPCLDDEYCESGMSTGSLSADVSLTARASLQMTNRSIYVTSLISLLTCLNAVAVSLEPLETVAWSVIHSNEIGERIPTSISFRAYGKHIGKEYTEDPVSEASYYGDPYSSCVAIIQATFSANEAWWGNLAAPLSERESDGSPKSTYVADSDDNWYRLYTAHTLSTDFPAPVGARIVNYLRIGGLHALDVLWTESEPGVGQTTSSALITVQEFMPGKFRFAPEWMDIVDSVTAAIRYTDQEDATMVALRESDPSFVREVHIYELFGGTAGEFPLVVAFRAMPFSLCPRAGEIAALQGAIATAAAGLPEDDTAYMASPSRQALAGYLTAPSLEMIDGQSPDWRKTVSIFDSVSVVIDGGSFLFLGRSEGDPPTVAKGLDQLYDDGGDLKLTNYHTQMTLSTFLNDPRIWSALGPKLTEVATE